MLVQDERLSTPGKRMRFLREAKGMTQVTFARKLHTSQPAVSQWERDRWLPEPAMRRTICTELGATESFVFGEQTERLAS